ncbi:MAG TPA: class F sortase [Actinomycetota bacterium]|nr:class F sortase [Actinomycetota bacterium]
MKEFLMRGGRRGLVATVAVGVLAASGATAIAVAVAAQKHAPVPPSAAGSLGPAAVSPTPSENPRPSDAIPASSKPVSIDIPVIDVHSTLQYLGLTAQGTLQVPAPGPHYNEAAWYKYSPTPGSLGPAVISGHVDSVAQGPSVFFILGDLRRGDKVLVTRADGLVAVFRVDGVRRYPKDHFPTLLVYGNTDHAALRLITCGGPFDYATGHYVDNIVVFASLVGFQ